MAVQKGKEQAEVKKGVRKGTPEVEEVKTTKKEGGVKMADEKGAKAVEEKAEVSGRSRLVALLLCFFLGWAGGHRFYAGKVGTGLMMLFTMGGFGMWYFLDFVMISAGSFKDKGNLPIKNWK